MAHPEELEQVLGDELGPLASELYLIPRDGSSVKKLPFDWGTAKAYYTKYCRNDNDCPDGEFPSDCTHFVSHGLSKTKIIVNLPSAICQNGVCVRVKELAAAFKNSVARYSNVKQIADLSSTRERDYCFVVSWFGLVTDHAMVLAESITSAGGRVYGHTNSRCGEKVDLTGQTLVVYRIE
jgi:hypothetical protein